MANKKSNHKESYGYRIAAGLLALVLVAVFLFAGFGSSWFKNGNIATWYNSWGKDSDKLPDDGSEVGESIGGGMLFPSAVEGNGIRLMSAVIPAEEYEDYGIDAQAESAVSISVTLEPADATNKTITASLAFKNPSSEWASGKTASDYVTATVSGLRVALSCNEAFGEQIVLTIGTSNPEVTASATVDYAKRLILSDSQYKNPGFKFKNASGTNSYPGGSSAQYDIWKWDDYTPETDINNFGALTVEVTANNYSVGTVENPIQSYNIKFLFSGRMGSYLSSNGGSQYAGNGGDFGVASPVSVSIGKLFEENNIFGFCAKTQNGKRVIDTTGYNLLVRGFNSGYGDLIVAAQYNMTYGGTVVEEKEVEIGVNGVVVTNASTSQSGVVL